MAQTKQTIPNVHKVLEAVRELERMPVVQAYLALLESLRNIEQEG